MRRLGLWILVALGIAGLGVFGGGPRGDLSAASTSPAAELVLWAWERPEDLRFLAHSDDPEAPRTGVAPLLGTLRLSAAGLESRGRRQPLAVPRDMEMTVVVRLEVLPSDPPDLSGAAGERLVDSLVSQILAWIPEGRARALQIDFDARHSERSFYRRLLERLRASLPAAMELEITALASWCVGDPWLADLPIDDAVPMFFRMGRDDAPVRRRLARGHDLAVAICRASVGVSTDEEWPLELVGRPARGAGSETAEGGKRRLFVFHPRPWSAADYDAVLAEWASAVQAGSRRPGKS